MGSWLEKILQHIRARAMDRVAAAYAVAAWLVVQVASIALPAFDAPLWLLRWLIAVAIVGFPATLMAAWVWTHNRVTSGPAHRLKSRETVFLTAIALVAALTLGELAWHWSSAAPGDDEVSDAPIGSIAVLPFDNMSGDTSQKYISEGIPSELIGLLGRNPALRVAARTSSFFLQGKGLDVRAIAQKLHVRAVLEGSVQSDGTHMHIEASLVNAANGFQIWSQSYNRAISDILTVQDEIAQSIAQALVPTLTGAKTDAHLPKAVSIDPAIYRDYLQALSYRDQAYGTEGPEAERAGDNTMQLLRKVAAAAPDFADGQAAFADMVLNYTRFPPVNDEAQKALQKALALDPQNPVALMTQIDWAMNRWDWDTIIKYGAILKRTNSHTVSSAEGMAYAYESFALRDQAAQSFRDWARMDPFSVYAWQSVARIRYEQGRFPDAIAAVDQGMTLAPANSVLQEFRCVSLANLKRIAEAKTVLQAMTRPDVRKPLQIHCKFFIILNSEGQKAALAYINAAIAHDRHEVGPFSDLGFLLAHAGAFDDAMGWFEKAFDVEHFHFGFDNSATVPAAFFKNPRWIALTQRPAYQRWLAAQARARREL